MNYFLTQNIINMFKNQALKNLLIAEKNYPSLIKYSDRKLIIYYKSLPRVLNSLQKMWRKGKKRRHIETSTFILAQFAFSPGITANHYLPIITKFVEAKGVEGIDGIFLSAMSAAIHLAPDNFHAAHIVAGGLKGKCKVHAKNDFGICFLDLSIFKKKTLSASSFVTRWEQLTGKKIKIFADSPSYTLAEGGTKSSTVLTIDELGRIIIEDTGKLNEPYETGLGENHESTVAGKVHQNYEETTSILFSIFPDESRQSLFLGEDFVVPNRMEGLMNFGKIVRDTGSGRVPYNPRYREWVSSDSNFREKQVDFCVGALTLGSGILGGAVGLEFAAVGALPGAGLGLGIGGALGLMVCGTGVDEWNEYRSSTPTITPLGDTSDNSGTGTSNEVDDNSDEDGYVFTEEEVEEYNNSSGDTESPDTYDTYPVPHESSVGGVVTEADLIKFLDQFIRVGNALVPKNIVLPNPESVGNSMILVHDMPLNNLDPYIYPNPTELTGSGIQITQEELIEIIKEKRSKLINPTRP